MSNVEVTPEMIPDKDEIGLAEPNWDLSALMFGDHGIAYEINTTLGDKAWILAETVRRRFEKAGHVVRGQNPLLPEHVKQIVEKREREEC